MDTIASKCYTYPGGSSLPCSSVSTPSIHRTSHWGGSVPGSPGRHCWLVWLCVLRCCPQPEVDRLVRSRLMVLGVRWCVWLLGVGVRFVCLNTWFVAGDTGFPLGDTWVGLLPGALSPFIPFGVLCGLAPGLLIADGFFFPSVWFVSLPGWLPSGRAGGLLRESPCPFGLGWRA